jgi:DNA-binding transcriptional regulator YiaG
VSNEAVLKPTDIRAGRQRLGHSQTEFGALFRVSQPAAAWWERGTKKPQGRHAERLAELALEHLRDGGPAFTPANLVALRRQLNQTQPDFGVSRQTVAKWEDGLRKPHPSQLKVFANLVTKVTSMAAGPIAVRKTDLSRWPNQRRISSPAVMPSGCINANWGRKPPLAGNDAIAVLNESAIS